MTNCKERKWKIRGGKSTNSRFHTFLGKWRSSPGMNFKTGKITWNLSVLQQVAGNSKYLTQSSALHEIMQIADSRILLKPDFPHLTESRLKLFDFSCNWKWKCCENLKVKTIRRWLTAVLSKPMLVLSPSRAEPEQAQEMSRSTESESADSFVRGERRHQWTVDAVMARHVFVQ